MGVFMTGDAVVFKDLLANELTMELGERGKVFRNVRCSDYFNAKETHCFPIVVLTEQDVYLFTEIKSDTSNSSELFATIDYKLRVFENCFHTLVKDGYCFALLPSEQNLNTLDAQIHSEPYELFLYQPSQFGKPIFQKQSQADIVAIITNESSVPETVCFTDEEYKNIALKLSKHTSEEFYNKDKFTPKFEQDPEKVFRFALYGGFLGVHRFYLKMYGSGVLYLLTFGVFGIGWFFDCLEILLNAWRKKGRKLSALKNKKKHFLEFAGVFGILFTVIIVMSYF